jgi:hypothetical protein
MPSHFWEEKTNRFLKRNVVAVKPTLWNCDMMMWLNFCISSVKCWLFKNTKLVLFAPYTYIRRLMFWLFFFFGSHSVRIVEHRCGNISLFNVTILAWKFKRQSQERNLLTIFTMLQETFLSNKTWMIIIRIRTNSYLWHLLLNMLIYISHLFII